MAVAAESPIIEHPGAWTAADAAAWYEAPFTIEERHLDALDDSS